MSLTFRKCPCCCSSRLTVAFNGNNPVCNKCVREFWATDEKRAKQDFRNMKGRSGNRDGRHPTYADVECRIAEDDFQRWEHKELLIFRCRYPGKTPSVDRINSRGHYEIGNIQLLPKGMNSRKRRCCLPMWKARLIRAYYDARLQGQEHKRLYSQEQLARRFGTSIATISRVVNYLSHCE